MMGALSLSLQKLKIREVGFREKPKALIDSLLPTCRLSGKIFVMDIDNIFKLFSLRNLALLPNYEHFGEIMYGALIELL